MKKLKLLVMANESDIHTEKWLYGLSICEEFEIYLLGMQSTGVRKGILENTKVKQIFELPLPKKASQKGGNYQYLWNIGKICNIVRELKPDLIHAMYLTSYGFIGSLVRGKALLCHSMMGTDIMITPFKNRIYRLATQYALSRGDFFVFPSRAMYEKARTLHRIPEGRFLIQQYGVSDDVIAYPKQNKEYDVVSNRAWIPNSNILMLLEILSQLETSPRVALIGDQGLLENEIKHKLSFLPHVKHLGFLPFMENIEVVAKSKFYISLTASDGASLSIMEAMALGAIPILSNIEPSREWVQDGVNGFLIDLGNVAGAVEKIKSIFVLPEEQLQVMRERNVALIQERGSLRKNMGRLNQCMLSLMEQYRQKGHHVAG